MKKEIKIIISIDEKEIKSSNINLDDYKNTKELHGVSLVDEVVMEMVSIIEADK